MLYGATLKASATALLAGATAVGARVYQDRQKPLLDAKLPAIEVHMPRQSFDLLSFGTAPEYRVLADLVVEIAVQDNSDADVRAALETIGGQVVNRLLTSAAFVASVEQVLGVEVMVQPVIEGERQRLTAAVTFRLQYREIFEPVVEDVLETIHVDLNAIDPADPNRTDPPGSPGPDDRIEASMMLAIETPE